MRKFFRFVFGHVSLSVRRSNSLIFPISCSITSGRRGRGSSPAGCGGGGGSSPRSAAGASQRMAAVHRRLALAQVAARSS